MAKEKIIPNDPKNYSPIYIDKDGECVSILSDSFGEPDPYKMVVMSHDQFDKITRADLAQSLADALEDVLNAGRESSGRIILDIEQEESVRAALKRYRGE